MSGSTAGGVVGAAIGYYVGGSQGAQMGWMIGSAVGGYIDPTVIKGPRLTDAQSQTTMEGAPRPIVYGTAVVAGNIIQAGPLVERKHRDRAKGGSTVNETFTYTRTYAIRVCEGPVAGIRRIWRDEKLVYDVRDPDNPDDGIDDAEKWRNDILSMQGDTGKFGSILQIYLGNETQMPDASLEALPAAHGGGVGNVPAYRGTCYVVITDDDLTDRQGSVPQYRFEIAAGGTVSHIISNNTVYAAVEDSGVLQAGHEYDDWNNELDTGVTPATQDVLVQSVSGLVYFVTNGAGAVSGNRGFSWEPLIGIPALEPMALVYAPNYKRWFALFGGDLGLYSSHDAVMFTNVPCPIPAGHLPQCMIVLTALDTDILIIGGSGFILTNNGAWDETLGTGGEISAFAKSESCVIGVGTDGIRRSIDFGQTWSAPITHPLPSGQPVSVAYGNSRWLIVNNAGEVASSDNDGLSWDLRDSLAGGMGTGVKGPQNELIFDLGSNRFLVCDENIQASSGGDDWEVVWSGRGDEIRSLAFLNFYGAEAIPDIIGYYLVNGSVTGPNPNVITPTATYLDEILVDLASRVGINTSQIDVSDPDLHVRVRGFVVNGRGGTSAADNIRSLQGAFRFDLPEYGNWPETTTQLVGVPRGKASAFALTDDNFVQSDEDEDTRAQAVEFPRKINLITSDPNADYNPTKQTFERRTENVKAVGESTVELPLVFIRDEAAQTVEIMGKVAWEEALGRMERELPEEYSALVPSDCFTYDSKRWRAEECEYGDGTVKIKAVRDRTSAYTSTATSGDALGGTSPPSNIRGPVRFAAMNLPQLRTQDSAPGMYVAACGLLPGYAGCDLFMSIDGGVTERFVLRMLNEAVVGYLFEECTSSSEPISVVVEGELDSVTLDQLIVGANACAITTAGTSEIAQFMTATPVDTGYDLTDTQRGQQGTVAASHGLGDKFVLLDESVYFLPLDISLAGRTIIFRPVSIGTAPANNATYSVVFQPQFTNAPIIDFLYTEDDAPLTAENDSYFQVEF